MAAPIQKNEPATDPASFQITHWLMGLALLVSFAYVLGMIRAVLSIVLSPLASLFGFGAVTLELAVRDFAAALAGYLLAAPTVLLFGWLAALPLLLAELANRKLAYFYRQYPEQARMFSDRLTNLLSISFLVTWLVGALVFFVLGKYTDSVFIAVTVTLAIALTTIYGLLLFHFRQLGAWAFAQVRRIIVPYVLATPVAIVILGIGSYLLLYMTGWVWTKLGLSEIEVLFDHFRNDAAAGELSGVDQLLVTPWQFPFLDLLEGIVWSVCLALIIVWVLAALFRKDYLAFLLMCIGVSLPFVSPLLLEHAENAAHLLEATFRHVPGVVASVIVAVALDSTINWIKGLLKYNVTCSQCGTSLARTMRFCPVCGQKNAEADRGMDT